MVVFLVIIFMTVAAESLQLTHTNRIYRGSNAEPHSAPYIVSLRFFPEFFEPYHFCCGSILNENWVLSAGHCAFEFFENIDQSAAFKVFAGAHDFRQEPTITLQIREFAEIHVHPNMTLYNRNLIQFADLMLIRVSDRFEFNEFVQKITMAPKGYKPSGTATVFGWGFVFEPEIWVKYILEILQTKTFKLANQELCDQLEYELFDTKTGTFLCTDPRTDFFTVCSGDSGGPLVQNIDGEVRLIGVVSFASKYCSDKPAMSSISTLVTAFEDWIFKFIA